MPNLDIARSLAVLSVVAEHILLARGIEKIGPFEVAWFGFLGVLVFFVLTCLVLMWSLDRKPHTLDFYIRRIFRIYPLAILALILAVVFHAPTGGTPTNFFQHNDVTVKSFLRQALLLPNTLHPLVSVMWSLPYEMSMYVLLPALYFFVRKNYSLWPLFVLWALALLYARQTPAGDHNFGTTIGYFLPGVMAYVAYERWQPKLPGWMLPLCLCVLWIVFWYHANFHRSWAFCLIFGLILPLFRQVESAMITTPSRIIARYSYGIYLTHPFAIAFGFYFLREHAAWVQSLALTCALVLLPLAAYHFLEQPLIRLGSRLARKAETRFAQSERQPVKVAPAS